MDAQLIAVLQALFTVNVCMFTVLVLILGSVLGFLLVNHWKW